MFLTTKQLVIWADFFEKRATQSLNKTMNKFAQTANPVLGHLSTAKTSLNGMLAKLKELKADPGSYPPGSIDAAIDQINNALQQLGQAEREATKGVASEELNRYLGDIGKYYGYAKGYIKPNPGIWDSALDATLSSATTTAATLNAPPAATTPGKNPATPGTTKPVAKPAAHRPVPTISAEVQRGLNYLGFVGKDYKQLDDDGKRGPNTDFALNAFKNSSTWKGPYNIQDTATPEELSTLVLQAVQAKKSGNVPQDETIEQRMKKGPIATIGQPPATSTPSTAPEQVASNTVNKNDPGY